MLRMRGERREAKRDGAVPVKNSGRGFKKGDSVQDGEWLVDYKHNEFTFTLKATAWAKHSKDAWNDGHYKPLIKVIFGDGRMVAIVDWDDFLELKERFGTDNEV